MKQHIYYDVEYNEWFTGHDLPFTVIDGPISQTHIIPQGFSSDLASIPRFLWFLIAPHELGIDSALIHDFMYRNHIGSRELADRMFLWNMELSGVRKWKRNVAYRAVRAFGGSKYQ